MTERQATSADILEGVVALLEARPQRPASGRCTFATSGDIRRTTSATWRSGLCAFFGHIGDEFVRP